MYTNQANTSRKLPYLGGWPQGTVVFICVAQHSTYLVYCGYKHAVRKLSRMDGCSERR